MSQYTLLDGQLSLLAQLPVTNTQPKQSTNGDKILLFIVWQHLFQPGGIPPLVRRNYLASIGSTPGVCQHRYFH